MDPDPAPRTEAFTAIPDNPVPEDAETVWYSSGGLCLRAAFLPSPDSQPARGTCLVCPGRTEYIEKYFEVGEALRARGFAVVIFDWPGQGLSERLLDDRMLGHIDRFETYFDAMSDGIGALGDRLPRPFLVLAHSMGGAIALGAMVRSQVEVAGAAFSAPMWGLKADNPALRPFAQLVGWLGGAAKPARPAGPPETFETNIVTHDETRWRRQRALTEAMPALALGTVSWGWLRAALEVTHWLGKPRTLATLSQPVFLASAQQEALVDNGAHARLAAQLPDCEHVTIQGARHEILMETDARRAEFWAGFDRLVARAGL